MAMKLGDIYLRYWWVRRVVTVLSYFHEIRLEAIHQESDTPSIISLKSGRLMLGTDRTIYSWDDRYMNFVWGLEHIQFDSSKKYSVLLLGFGLGAIPFILEKKMKIDFQMVGVEINPDIVHLAQKYSLNRLKSSVKVYCADAYQYMQSNVLQHDLVIVDICIEDNIPKTLESEEFLLKLKNALNPSGILLYNRFYSSYKDQYKTDTFYKNSFQSIFPNSKLIDQGGTCLLYWVK
jgi:spermidine synthase